MTMFYCFFFLLFFNCYLNCAHDKVGEEEKALLLTERKSCPVLEPVLFCPCCFLYRENETLLFNEKYDFDS